MTKSKNPDEFIIRPAGRHVLTIGRDLVHDPYAAIVELVKNAYDADSPDVHIDFRVSADRNVLTITVQDQGHGMSRNTIVNNWLVPSTSYKLQQKRSPNGRIMQGRKGIGRYATAILGDDLLMETITPEGEKTTLCVVWKDFENAEFLDQVPVIVETTEVSALSGTSLIITGGKTALAQWTTTQIDKLIFELKKLISPVSDSVYSCDGFQILLSTNNLFQNENENKTQLIEPYPLVELFDYRITGTVSTDGNGTLVCSIKRAPNIPDEQIFLDLKHSTRCGDVTLDIRVYDREKEAMESLSRGLASDSGEPLAKLDTRNLLNQYNGVGVYRNGFRIRPLGDADSDWLKLNEMRVQNPSFKIGSNQIIGYVQIQAEEQSGLVEKSARDGLAENEAFAGLKEVTHAAINKLEEKRFAYRKKAGLSRPALKVERELEKLFAFDELKRSVRSKLKKLGVDQKATDDIIEAISAEEEGKNKIAEEIRQAVAIYQGQATLGKIISVILHEGRRPLNYFTNQIPTLRYWYNTMGEQERTDKLSKLLPIADGIAENAETFVKLFKRLDPLAPGKRSARRMLPLKSTITKAFAVFEEELKTKEISLEITGSDSFKILGWEQDFYAIFTNLADNSIYWIMEKKDGPREIKIDITTDQESLGQIDYKDSGLGIDPDNIESEIIFEPHFTTKIGGTGLGLAIAGEAASRNDLELKAFESLSGAHFRLQPLRSTSR